MAKINADIYFLRIGYYLRYHRTEQKTVVNGDIAGLPGQVLHNQL